MRCTSFLYLNYAGLPVEDEVFPKDIFTPLDYELFKDKIAYVYDDNENLVRLTLDDDNGNMNSNEKIGDIANHVFFFLYKKDNPDPKQLHVNDENVLKNSNFDPTKPTRFVTHGWVNSRDSPVCILIRDGK